MLRPSLPTPASPRARETARLVTRAVTRPILLLSLTHNHRWPASGPDEGGGDAGDGDFRPATDEEEKMIDELRRRNRDLIGEDA